MLFRSLTLPTVLAGLGVIDSEAEVTYTVERPDGSIQDVAIPSIERETVSGLVTIRDRLGEQGVTVPVSRRDTEKLYRYEFLAEHDALYVQYNSCREDDSYPMDRFVDDVFGTIRERDASGLIVDLRRNGGGDSRVLHPFIDEVVAWSGGESGERDGGRTVCVIIGRYTFSSAVLNAIDLKQRADAVFVGEPSGGRPNHYGEVKSLQLPDLGRRVTYSTKYFTHYKAGDPPALMPDIDAPDSFEAYVRGRDPALETALEACSGGGAD